MSAAQRGGGVPGAGPRAPGPRGLSVLGVIRRRSRDPFQVMVELAAEYGPVVEIRVGGTSHFLVSSPEAARHVLVEHQQNYPKGPGYAIWGRLLGQGLVTSDGDHWRSHRRLVQPSLHRDRMARFVEIMAGVAEEEAADLETSVGTEVDLYGSTTRMALCIAARAFLGSDLRQREDELCAALVAVFDHLQALSESPIRALGMIPGVRALAPLAGGLRTRFDPGERRFEAALETLEAGIGEVVARRREELRRGRPGDDLVGRLLEAAAEDPDVELTDRDIRDEVMTMFVAGHETTAAGLAWCLRLLADHPDVQREVVEEARDALGAKSVALADLDRLPLARRVFQESLRLFPPVWRVSRRAARDDRLGGFPVPAGSVVIVSPWLIHRDPELWPDPDRFRPERFEDDSWPRDAWLPFGVGRRMCPGGAFATGEAQVLLATILRRVALRPPASGAMPAFEPRLTLRPKGGVPLRIEAPAPSTP